MNPLKSRRISCPLPPPPSNSGSKTGVLRPFCAQVFPDGHDAERMTGRLLDNHWKRLHRRDGVHLVPPMVRVVNICAPDLISLADLGFKVGAVVAAAGFCSVCLAYFPLADWFENEITLLSQDVLLVQEGLKLLVQAK